MSYKTVIFFCALHLVTICSFSVHAAEVTGLSTGACEDDSPTIPRGRYVVLACRGIEHMRAARYDQAAILFKEALAIPLHEAPNFELFTKFALALFRGGHDEEAKEALEMAELSLSVITGVLRCVERIDDASQTVLRKVAGGTRVSSPYEQIVVMRMCGAEQEGARILASLEEAATVGRLVEEFLAARVEISPSENQ